MRVGLSLFLVGASAMALGFFARDANACGGCFPPPGEQNSVVTDHRMVLSVSKAQSTLYDQIQYTGSPKEFAWVLPISGTVEVGLSADSMFAALNSLSAVTVLEPPRNCPPPPVCDDQFDEEGSRKGVSLDAGSASTPPGVDVLKKEVVGPYETVQLASTDALALETWLTTNGFNIPADIKPIIAQYVAEKFNFLALKLKPGEGTSAMRPVRITTPGASAALPLRMVAAGTGATVGITLWVVSEGRYEPQNFPSFVIKDDDLVWDWATSTSNYKTLRAERSKGGNTWEIESAININRSTVENAVRFGVINNGGFGGGVPFNPSGDYLPVEDENGNQSKSSDQVRDEDLVTVFKGIAFGVEHLTRLRADLSRTALTTDLSMIASQDQSNIEIARNPKHEAGQPQCAVFDNQCNQTGTLPRDQAKTHADALAANKPSSDASTFSCATTTPSSPFSIGYGAIGAFLGLAIARAARNRRRYVRGAS